MNTFKNVVFDVGLYINIINLFFIITSQSILTSKPHAAKSLIEKLIVDHLFKKSCRFYGTPRITASFTSARHWSLLRSKRINSTPSEPIFYDAVWYYFPYVRRCDTFSLSVKFTDLNLYASLFLSHWYHIRRPSHTSWFHNPSNM